METLRRIAKTLAAEVADMGNGPPYDVRTLCAALGVTVDIQERHPAFDGLSFIVGDAAYILCNGSHHKPWQRLRFTLAHELGHIQLYRYLLERKWLSRIVTTRESEAGVPLYLASADPSAPIERAANAFAANLLMPEHHVRAMWADLESNAGYRLEIICGRLGVSGVALRVRLEELGLLPKFGAGKRYR